ncbi:hypothetical protein [Levilactobacillus sp. N40-8-2]|uniref:hypothetical protein n=1 Tax=Levilactobacillus muriae TaxID=3238987 RepID=UPI0038B2C9C6
MNTEFFAQQVAAEVRAGFSQHDLVNIKSHITMAAAMGKKVVDVEVKYLLSDQLIGDLANYNIYADLKDTKNGNIAYQFYFDNAQVES